MNLYSVNVSIKNKDDVLSPEACTTEQSLHNLGYKNISNISIKRVFSFQITAESKNSALDQTKMICDALLANPVIEDYEIEISEFRDEKN